MPPSMVRGYNEKHMVTDISISDLCFNGKHITDINDLNIEVGEFTSNVLLKA